MVYIVIQDFTGRQFKPDPDGSFTSKSFTRGAEIVADAVIDSNGVEHLVTPDGFLVEGNVERRYPSNQTPKDNNNGASIFTTKNIIIGVVALIGIAVILKFAKVF